MWGNSLVRFLEGLRAATPSATHGKTQTALEYAYRYRAEYDAIFWVRADSTTALTSSLVELASVLQLPERNEKDQEIIVQAVLRWLRLHPDWLLIYDNMDDLSVAEPFLPKAGPGHLLFTTRARAFGGLAQRLDIEKMDPDIGALLLLRRASLLAVQATLSKANPGEQNMARTISEELDGLPLALDQAGAYIKEAPCSLPDYLPRYQTRRSDILGERGQSDQDYPASVATTWSLSFERVCQANPAAAELLNFCAFLAPDAIPETLIIKGARYLPLLLQKAVVHPLQFDQEAISPLLAYSLLRRNTDETLNVHRLVQTVLRDALPLEAGRQWKQRVVLAVGAASPDAQEKRRWDASEQWLPHALVGTIWIEQEQMTNPEAILLLDDTGYYLHDRARYAEAEPLLVRALSICEQEGGINHPYTARSLIELGTLYRTQGKYIEAEPVLVWALSICRQEEGSNRLYATRCLTELAQLFLLQGKYTDAEQLYHCAHVAQEPLSPVGVSSLKHV